MQYRSFGTTELTVSEIGVGCSRIGGLFSSNSSAREESELLLRAMDSGINFFDTADVYSHGQSEMLVGKAASRRRSEVVIATKAGYAFSAKSRLLGRMKPLVRPVVRRLRLGRPAASAGPRGVGIQDFSPAYLVAAVDRSLRRLGTEYIDIFQLHSPPGIVVQAGEYVSALEGLRTSGKIRYFGIAVDEVSELVGIETFPSISAVEVPFNVIDQQALNILPTARTSGIGVISRSCFAAGLLTGAADALSRGPIAGNDAIAAFGAVAAKLGRSPKELALQFSLSVEGFAVTLVGMRTLAHLEENLECLSAPRLTESELTTLFSLAGGAGTG
jgi:aryl-alcohol dehydrogenase-like predicted oxidoreductase